MKTKTFLSIKVLTLFSFIFLLNSCTDLDEVFLDEIPGNTVSDPAGSLAAAYDRLGDGTFTDHGAIFAMQEYTTDEAILPTRGSDWGDGGKWRDMHEFTWSSSNSIIVGNWDLLTNGITRCITAIQSAEQSSVPEKKLFAAEAKALLAFYTYTTLDLYGQAPYKDPMDPKATLQILKADTQIDKLITDVEALLPDLADIGTQRTHHGRFTKQAGYAFLATMYLNRAVFKDRYNPASSFNFNEPAVSGTGTDMDRVIYYTSLLIDSGKYSLESDFFKNFARNNENGKELIFAITQKIDYIRNGSNSFAYVSMERNQRASAANRGTNAACITPEFYASWAGNHDDPRFEQHYQYADGTWFMNDGTDVSVPATDIVPKSANLPWFHFNRGIQAGLQYGPILLPSGSLEMIGNRIKVSPLFMEKSTGTRMNFTPTLTFADPNKSVFAQNEINQGARVFKYEFDPEGGNGNSNVDIPLFRLGGIYAMRAEAYFRKGSTGLAMDDLNKLRTSRTRESLFANAPGKALTSLDAEQLYKELGFELYWELQRRPESIRFGKFDLAGTAKAASQPFRRTFPIPQTVIDQKVFKQNQGYN
ncbi:RagB/SusD family nutrient uptake outer membrane protein [Flavobacterium circumlabens]|uniref:Outer membrane starch-binding protein n=1 Tax=Flavobacterium circumlabens TaxID=2133765 RepID=A0A4Y7UGS1_9FLAO|nr:RagB/SusD family nutrient uptake outer membrane protein [Flavobacterium circumlabens]TCN59832.1 putative outer membrane starch-binding protein [Flavobacterium circumlabens]TEB45088.1 RagB/SusD family nutrient uptake outer membrane protein [Flavobacterium circumlabens]